MGRRVTSSEATSPESTDAALQKTGGSLPMGTRSEGSDLTPGAPRPSSTRTETPSSEHDVFLQVLGGVMSRGFTSSDQVSLWLRQLQRMGFEREALLIAEGFNNNRSAGMQDFMG